MRFSKIVFLFVAATASSLYSGCSDSNNDTVNSVIPDAAFSYTSQRALPISVQFVNTSSGGATMSYLWDFGDGTTSTLANPTHIYAAFGTYAVSLIETDIMGGSDTLTQALSFSPTGPSGTSTGRPSTANFTFSIAPEYVVRFRNLSTGAGNFNWIFGDGSSGNSTDSVVTHTYSGAGPFNVELVATTGANRDTSRAILAF